MSRTTTKTVFSIERGNKMKFEDGIFEEEYITRFSQTSANGEVTNKSIISLLENTSGEHSAYCKFSIVDIISQNLTWFILSWKVKIIKRPKALQKVRVQTWGRPVEKLIALRDFKIFDENGELISIATSTWCLVNTKTGRITKMPENLEEIYHKFPNEAVFNEEEIEKLTIPKSEAKYIDEYKIRRFDLDGNMHVHNLNYIDFAYELLPEEVYNSGELNNLEIVYKKEIKYGETIKSSLYVENNCYTIVIRDEKEEIVHAIVKLYN